MKDEVTAEPPHAPCDPHATLDDPDYCSICTVHPVKSTYVRTGPCDIVGCDRPGCSTEDVSTLIEELITLVAYHTDSERCSFDHNGSCQMHGDFYIEPGELCVNEQKKNLLKRLGYERDD